MIGHRGSGRPTILPHDRTCGSASAVRRVGLAEAVEVGSPREAKRVALDRAIFNAGVFARCQGHRSSGGLRGILPAMPRLQEHTRYRVGSQFPLFPDPRPKSAIGPSPAHPVEPLPVFRSPEVVADPPRNDYSLNHGPCRTGLGPVSAE